MGCSCCSLRSTRIWVCMWGFSIQAVLLPCAVSRTALFGFLRNLLSLGCVNIWVISFTVLLCFKKEDCYNSVTASSRIFYPFIMEQIYNPSAWVKAAEYLFLFLLSPPSHWIFPLWHSHPRFPRSLEPCGKAGKHETMFIWTPYSSLVLLMLWNIPLKQDFKSHAPHEE